MGFKQKPLNQSEYKMKIVEDLGNVYNGNRTNRYALCECTKCSQVFKVRMGSSAAKKQETCVECTKSKTQYYKHPLYAIWNGIVQRCHNPKRKDYSRYGGVGITVCEEWRNNADAFIEYCLNNGWDNTKVVDKDILSNKLGISPAVYSPQTISFVSQSDNCREASGRKILQYTKDMIFIREWDSAIEAAHSVGLKSGDPITNTCRGRAKTSAGYIWKYTPEHD